MTALLVLGLAGTAAGASASPSTPTAPRVVALVGDQGINPIHAEFLRQDTVLLPDDVSIDVVVDAAAFGSLDGLRASGELADVPPGAIVRVDGTNLVLVNPTGSPVDLLADVEHGTMVAAAAGGTRAGSDPDALLVFVASNDPVGWEWASRQPWIDVVTTSAISLSTQCDGYASPVARLVDRGVQVFSAAGNGLSDVPSSAAGSPASLPDVYRVGGVDADGAPTALAVDQPGNPGPRGYDTGDLYTHPALPVPTSTTEYQVEDGTSFATPHTAGRAARLIAHARDLLGDAGASGPRASGLLARGRATGDGVLADGELTRSELVEVLHAVARPYYPRTAGSYALEGWGAVVDAGDQVVTQALTQPLPAPSPDLEAVWRADMAARAARVEANRCTA